MRSDVLASNTTAATEIQQIAAQLLPELISWVCSMLDYVISHQ